MSTPAGPEPLPDVDVAGAMLGLPPRDPSPEPVTAHDPQTSAARWRRRSPGDTTTHPAHHPPTRHRHPGEPMTTSTTLLRDALRVLETTHQYRGQGGHDTLGENLTCAGCHLAQRIRDHLAQPGQPDALTAITRALEDCRTLVPAVQARHVLDALQSLYVPPPPGSDRDALPPDLRALIQPHMPEYLSTACQAALALDRASTIHLPSMVTLMDWERRQHAACRITRKQDMAKCICDCHTGRPVVPAVAPGPDGDPVVTGP